jgi:hypothetical protein
MADIVLELSGLRGLSNGHAGDSDMVTPQPNLRISEEENQFVGGFFNPYLRRGYLSPTTTTTVSLSTSTSPDSEFTSVEYDNQTDTTYFGDNTNNIFSGNGLNDTSLTLGLTLEDNTIATYTNRKYNSVYDLQIYQINGQRKLFFVGEGVSYGGINDRVFATQETISDYIALSASINPSGTTVPSVLGTARSYFSAAGNEETSYSLVGGTDTCLWCMVFADKDSVDVTAQWRDQSGSPTYSMTEITKGTIDDLDFYLFQLVDPQPVTTGVVRTFVNTGGFDRLVYVFETDNTNQTNPGDGSVKSDTNQESTNILFDADVYDANQLVVIGCQSDSVTDMTVLSSKVEETLYSNTNSLGSELLVKLKDQGYGGLQVGYCDIDLSTGDAQETWLASQAVGAFGQPLNGDYAFMRNADNGFAYVFADNHVHKIDGNTTGGQNGTATKDVLLFPDYFRISDAVDYRSNMYIALNSNPLSTATTNLDTFRGTCAVYVWNRISTQLSAADYIEIPGVREIKKIYASPSGVLMLITISDSGITELRRFGYNDSGGVVFPVVRELGIGAYPQYPDGCTVGGDKTFWLANNGVLYCEKDTYVTKLHEVKTPGTTSTGLAENISSGALFYGSGSETADSGYRSNKQGIVMSYDDGSIVTEKIYPFDITTGDNSTQTSHAGNVYTGVQYIPITSKVNRIRIYNAPTANSDSTVIATVKIYFNQSTSATMPNGITKSITKKEASRGYVDFNINKPYIHAVQIEVEWASGTPLGDDMYLPTIAIINTEDIDNASPDNE